MRYEVALAAEAVEDFKKLSARDRSVVSDGIEKHLRHQPMTESKSRVRRLRDLSHPEYRLRLGDIRVFYVVKEDTVVILGIVPKSEAASWLRGTGERG